VRLRLIERINGGEVDGSFAFDCLVSNQHARQMPNPMYAQQAKMSMTPTQ
jgi:hypothetical protein